MKESGRIAGIAFRHAMKMTKPGMNEHQIAAILEYHSKMFGAEGLSYVPVVASGSNSLILHYVINNAELKYILT